MWKEFDQNMYKSDSLNWFFKNLISFQMYDGQRLPNKEKVFALFFCFFFVLVIIYYCYLFFLKIFIFIFILKKVKIKTTCE